MIRDIILEGKNLTLVLLARVMPGSAISNLSRCTNKTDMLGRVVFHLDYCAEAANPNGCGALRLTVGVIK